jgi:4-carboxymuconolactone decarboxylase
VARLDKLLPVDLNAAQRAVYESIVGGPRAGAPRPFPLVDENGGLEGPFNAMLLHPPLGSALQALGAAIRYEGLLSGRAREMAILSVAVHWSSDFEWLAHEAVGRAAGLDDEDIASLRSGRCPVSATPVEQAVVATTKALMEGDLDDTAFSAAIDGVGLPGLFNLVTLVGYYQLLALQLRVFQVTPPDRS